MIQYDPSGTNNRKTKQIGWVPGRSIHRPTRRMWDSPRNLRSAAKTMQRQRFALVASMWTAIGQPGIIAWNDAVAGYKSMAPAGVKMPDSGFTLFMYVGINLMACGSPVPMLPPTPIAVPVLSVSGLSITFPTSVEYTIDNGPLTADWRYFVRMSGNESPGVQSTKEGVQLLDPNRVVQAGSTFSDWLPTSFFAETPRGSRRNLSFLLTNNVTGQLSNLVLAHAVRP